MTTQPIITLTTDFGTQDGYVGAMKGVLLSMCPNAILVDITHDIPPQDLTHAALTLQRATSWYPSGTVHLIVVDPGVGTARHPIAARIGEHTFVAPDNGVLSLLLNEHAPTCHILDPKRVGLPNLSNTFHGRDLFSPAAARLARGEPIHSLGPALHDLQRLSVLQPQTHTPTHITGHVLSIDHFGNIITTIQHHHLQHLPSFGVTLHTETQQHTIHGPVATYAHASTQTPVALFGSDNYLEISINQGNAAQSLGISRGVSYRIEVKSDQ